MGTVINFQTNDEGTWFHFFYSRVNPDTMDVEYDDPIEDGPRMKIRNPVEFFNERARNRKTKSEFILNKKSRQMEKVVSELELTPAEKQKENEDFAEYVIMEAEGFKLNGREMKNTRADKVAAMKLPLVNLYVNKCVLDLQNQSAVEEKAEGKNSSTGSGSKTSKSGPE